MVSVSSETKLKVGCPLSCTTTQWLLRKQLTLHLLFLCCTCSLHTQIPVYVFDKLKSVCTKLFWAFLWLPIAGGRRAAEEKGDLRRRFSFFSHGDFAHEGRRSKHPHPGTLRALLCHRSHHWQAGPVKKQTDRAQWQTNGRRARKDTRRFWNREVFWVYVDSFFFLFLFFKTCKAISWRFVWVEIM